MVLQKLAVLASAISLFFSVSIAAAAGTGKMEMQGYFWEEAQGDVTIRDAGADKKEITIDARNLVPDSLFTVWFVNEGEVPDRKGVGQGDNSFTTDSAGKGHFSAIVPEGLIEDWDKLEVAFHPEGDPENLENLHVALIGDLGETG